MLDFGNWGSGFGHLVSSIEFRANPDHSPAFGFGLRDWVLGFGNLDSDPYQDSGIWIRVSGIRITLLLSGSGSRTRG